VSFACLCALLCVAALLKKLELQGEETRLFVGRPKRFRFSGCLATFLVPIFDYCLLAG
jgi:hypothetical protein